MKTILAIDPSGDARGMTGIALVGYDDTTAAHGLASWAIEGGIEPFREWVNAYVSHPNPKTWGVNGSLVSTTGEWNDGWAEPGVEAYVPNTVVVEHFVQWRTAADISPLGMEYIVRWLWPDAVLSPASGKNTAIPDTALKHLGMYEDSSHHHDVREASRHAVRWLKEQGHVPTLRKAFPK